MNDLFDEKTGYWYQVERGWRGRLRLRKIVYTHIVRAPTNNDVGFSDEKGLQRIVIPEPPTPCRICGGTEHHEHSGVRIHNSQKSEKITATGMETLREAEVPR